MKPFDVVDFKLFRLLPVLIIPIVLFATFSFGSNIYSPDEDGGGVEIIWEGNSATFRETVTVQENTESEFSFDVPQMTTWINGTLDWTDEAVRLPLQNQPDDFEIALLDPNGTEVDSAGPSSTGLSFNFQITYEIDDEGNPVEVNNSGEWSVVMRCTNAGDIFGPLGIFQRQADTGNSVDLNIRIEFIEKKEITTTE
jgi:hypothetical protein